MDNVEKPKFFSEENGCTQGVEIAGVVYPDVWDCSARIARNSNPFDDMDDAELQGYLSNTDLESADVREELAKRHLFNGEREVARRLAIEATAIRNSPEALSMYASQAFGSIDPRSMLSKEGVDNAAEWYVYSTVIDNMNGVSPDMAASIKRSLKEYKFLPASFFTELDEDVAALEQEIRMKQKKWAVPLATGGADHV